MTMADVQAVQGGEAVAGTLDTKKRARKQSAGFLDDIDGAKSFIQARKDLLAAITDPKSDIVNYGKEAFKRKSFWRKLALIAGVSIEKREEWKEKDERGGATYFVTVRASLPDGHFMDGTGACSQFEPRHNGRGKDVTPHYLRATAETRAKNRALSDLLAFGEVSAEELDILPPDETAPGAARPVRTASPDEQSGLAMIEALRTVLPGSAEKMLADNLPRKRRPPDIENTIRNVIIHELREIHEQGYFSLDDARTMAYQKFRNGVLERMTYQQAIELLAMVQERISKNAPERSA
ncbi:MAG: hypothetical protein A2Y33_06315 [Spirochaetes bacterium GWF1_51_8]|nr:MAG: hypothetical protein A2Y33_06315 [Spirochaetes bacterium GWF1_51_8]